MTRKIEHPDEDRRDKDADGPDEDSHDPVDRRLGIETVANQHEEDDEEGQVTDQERARRPVQPPDRTDHSGERRGTQECEEHVADVFSRDHSQAARLVGLGVGVKVDLARLAARSLELEFAQVDGSGVFGREVDDDLVLVRGDEG